VPRPKRTATRYYLKQLKGGSIWHICWTDETGKPISRSTRTADEAAAKQFLAAFVEAVNAPPEEANITLADICRVYAANKEAEYKQLGYVKDRAASIHRSLKPALDRWGKWHPSALTRNVGRDFIREMKPHYSTATINRTLSLVNAALNYCHKEGYITKYPSLELTAPPPPKERWLRPEEAKRLLSCCVEAHVRLFVMLALHTCSRKGAILDLTWQQVDLERKVIHYNAEGRVQNKKRRVSVPINETLYSALVDARELAVSNYVIEYGGKPVLDIKRGFAAACRRAKLEKVTPHTLRHTGATWLAQAGIPLWQIAGMLGDAVDTVTKHYAKHHPDNLREAVNALKNIC
jgi:integrase